MTFFTFTATIIATQDMKTPLRFAQNVIRSVTRSISAWAWRNEIEICEGITIVKGMCMDDDKLDMFIQHDPAIAQLVAKCFASLVASSPNYTELTFELREQYKGKYEHITVLVQKSNGKTPHQCRIDAERERDDLRVQLNKFNS